MSVVYNVNRHTVHVYGGARSDRDTLCGTSLRIGNHDTGPSGEGLPWFEATGAVLVKGVVLDDFPEEQRCGVCTKVLRGVR